MGQLYLNSGWVESFPSDSGLVYPVGGRKQQLYEAKNMGVMHGLHKRTVMCGFHFISQALCILINITVNKLALV